MQGLELKRIDERENNAELAINMRYTMNAKKVSLKKMFNKKKEESKVINLFNSNKDKEKDGGLVERIKIANDYFRNKNKK